MISERKRETDKEREEGRERTIVNFHNNIWWIRELSTLRCGRSILRLPARQDVISPARASELGPCNVHNVYEFRWLLIWPPGETDRTDPLPQWHSAPDYKLFNQIGGAGRGKKIFAPLRRRRKRGKSSSKNDGTARGTARSGRGEARFWLEAVIRTTA